MRVGKRETSADLVPRRVAAAVATAWAVSTLRAAAESAASHAVGAVFLSLSSDSSSGGRAEGRGV